MFSSFCKKSRFLCIVAVFFICGLGGVFALENNNEDINKNEEQEDEIVVKLPSKKRSFFYTIDSNVLKGVEIGSPDSLRQSMQLIRQSSEELTENEKVLIAVAAEMMKIAWPSEKVTWDVYPVSDKNPYIGALNSAKEGIFDSSTGNVDFLSTLLPAFVLFENSSNRDLYDLCENAISLALEKNPDSVIAKYLMAFLQEKKGDYLKSEKYLKEIYEICPNVEEITLAYIRSLRAYIRSLRANGNLELASRILGEVGEVAGDLEILKQNAYIAFDMKDYGAAEYYVARVLQQTPNNLEFVLFRAKILIEKKDYIHAVSLLDMYSRYDDKSLDYLLLRAKVQLDWSKNTTAATETIEKALSLYPDDFNALLIAAKISSITGSPIAGKYSDELAAIVLEKQPENIDALNYALEGLIQRKSWDKAYEISKKLISQKDVSSDIIYKYVIVCVELGKADEAYDYVKKVHNKNPKDETILYAYVIAYGEVGDRNAVMKYINSLLPTVSPKLKSYLYYRRSFLQTSEDKILADLRSCLISNPRNSDALFRLYEVYYNKGDYRKAQYYLRQVVAINPNDTSLKQLNDALSKMIK